MRRIITIASVLALATLGWFAAISTTGVYAQTSDNDWENAYTGLWLTDPNSGGSGTPVTDQGSTGFDSQDWVLSQDTGRCGGNVTSTCPGGWISANQRGDELITLRTVDLAGQCAGSTAADAWALFMITCDGYQGAQEGATVFAWDPGRGCGSYDRFWSWKWNESHSSGGRIVDFDTGVPSLVSITDTNVLNNCTQASWISFVSRKGH